MSDLASRVCALNVGFPGVAEWFRHGAGVGLWRHVELEEGGQDVPDAEVYLLGAWHQAYVGLVPQLKDLGARVFVAWSSSPTESDLAPIEMNYLLGFAKQEREVPIDGVLALDPGVASAMGFDHLPAPVHVEDVSQVPWEDKRGIGFYAPATSKKNIFTQLLAVKQVQREWAGEPAMVRLHTNLDRYTPVLKGLGLDFAMEGWVSRPAHLARLARRKVALSVSHGEAWCYGALDAMMAGTPALASETVRCGHQAWTVADPNGVQGLVDDLQDGVFADHPAVAASAASGTRMHIVALAEVQNKWARVVVEELVGS